MSRWGIVIVWGCVACHDDAMRALTDDTQQPEPDTVIVERETSVTPTEVVASDADVAIEASADDASVDGVEAGVDVAIGVDTVEPGDTVEPVETGDTEPVEAFDTVAQEVEVPPESAPGERFFAVDVLHALDIVVADEWLETLDNDTSVRVPCDVTYDGEKVVSAGCRKKGQSTLRPLSGKPSFSIKLDEFQTGADIDGVERFNAHNTVMDPTFTSEPLTYLLYERAGIPAPRTAHAVLRLNGETKGFYVIVEAIGKRFLRQRFGDGSGNLYEGPWDFDQAADNVELKDEDEGRSRADMFALQAAIIDVADADLVDRLTPHLDVDQALLTFAVDMAYCLWDGYTIAAWNFYLYHLPGGRFVFLPHGADWPYYNVAIDPLDADFRPWGEQYPPGLLAVRLMRVAAPQYRAKLSAVVASAFDVDVLHARIAQIEGVLDQADDSDEALVWERDDATHHMDDPRDFVTERRAYLVDALGPN